MVHKRLSTAGVGLTWEDDKVAPSEIELRELPAAHLFALYRRILKELRGRGVIRTENAPTGDYAEHLTAVALGGELAPNSEKSWDVRLPDGTRLQVKARVVSTPRRAGQLQLSPFRSFDFDEAVIVLLDERDYMVERAVRVPRDLVQAASRYNRHVNGNIAFARPELLSAAGTADVTGALRDAATRC
jgi:hypothetical protein